MGGIWLVRSDRERKREREVVSIPNLHHKKPVPIICQDTCVLLVRFLKSKIGLFIFYTS
jgi:hypothetical protein